jgi:hypothetical protein
MAYPGDTLPVREFQELSQAPVEVVGNERHLRPNLVKWVGQTHPPGLSESSSGTASFP